MFFEKSNYHSLTAEIAELVANHPVIAVNVNPKATKNIKPECVKVA